MSNEKMLILSNDLQVHLLDLSEDSDLVIKPTSIKLDDKFHCYAMAAKGEYLFIAGYAEIEDSDNYSTKKIGKFIVYDIEEGKKVMVREFEEPTNCLFTNNCAFIVNQKKDDKSGTQQYSVIGINLANWR